MNAEGIASFWGKLHQTTQTPAFRLHGLKRRSLQCWSGLLLFWLQPLQRTASMSTGPPPHLFWLLGRLFWIGLLSGWGSLVSKIDLPLLTGCQASHAIGQCWTLEQPGHVSRDKEPARGWWGLLSPRGLNKAIVGKRREKIADKMFFVLCDLC